METKSDSLLSKVASFFREKGDSAESRPGAGAASSEISARDAAKASLRDRAKLKNHDDAVREREFRQLRKVIKSRRSAQGISDLSPPRTSVPSQLSGFNNTDRASTLQKIDVAEAQLEQWWGATAGAPLTTGQAPLRNVIAESVEPTGRVPLAADDDFDLDFTGMTPLAASEPMGLEMLRGETTSQPLGESAPPSRPPIHAEHASVIEEHPLSHIEECLRDAAICYSEGDYGKSEEMLLGALKGQRLESAEVELLTFALFDVYRATGQKSRFEVTAMDYAERVGRSPAEWFSIPEQLAALALAANAANTAQRPAAASVGATLWTSPATLDNTSLAQLQITMGNASASSIDWNQLRRIDDSAAPTLRKLVQKWSQSPIKLEWSGLDALVQSLALHTHQAGAREDEIWWRIHMDLLCMAGQTEAFENLALDYCIAFEVSPPNPTEVSCKLIEASSRPTLQFPELTEIVTPAAKRFRTDPAGVTHVPLNGDICGDASKALMDLALAAENAQSLNVSCDLLRRIDFTAANAIFNWTQSRESSGLEVHFTNVPRLVLVFLVMLGLEKNARLTMRNL